MSPPHAHDQLTCREFLDLLLQFVENDGGAGLAALGEQHLELCRACRDYLASYQETRRLSRAVAAEDEAGLPEDLLEQILAAAGAPLH